MNLRSTVSFILAGITPVAAAQSAEIAFEARSEVYFSSTQQTDRVTATIKGATCEEAVFDVSIRNHSTELFHRAAPLMPALCDWFKREPEQAKWALTHMVNAAVGPLRAANRSCAPPHDTGCVASPILERLRRADVPLLCFTTGEESGACVAFDPETKTVAEVWRYSE